MTHTAPTERNKTFMRLFRSRELLVFGGLMGGAGGIVLLLVPGFDIVVKAIGVAILASAGIILGILALRRRRVEHDVKQVLDELSSHDRRQLERTRRIEAAIKSERAKESRHEYVQEQALSRIEARVREAAAGPRWTREQASLRGPDVLFVTSNGAGLGHLTRLLAVADRMDSAFRVDFLTLSRAYKQVANMGYRIRYFPSAEATGAGTRLWNTTFRSHLQRLFTTETPKVVVFDGTVVYEGLIDVCRGHDIPLVWMQRGCWKPEAEERNPTRRDAAKVADHVIIPGDYGCNEKVDVGSGVDVTRVGPIVLTRKEEMLPAAEARTQLGLSPSSRHILFNLGGGIVSDSGSHLSILRELVSESLAGYEVSVVRSPLANEQSLPLSVNVIRGYPVARFANAFEFVVSAAGYNSVQEAVQLGIPAIVVPNEETHTDDQVRRAEEAARRGLVAMARTTEEVADRVKDLATAPHELNALRESLSRVSRSTGAEDAARAVQAVVSDYEGLKGRSDGVVCQ